MKIWIDADACPNVIKDIVFRAAKRTETLTILVANSPLHYPASPFIKKMLVPMGFDKADEKIVQLIEPGDLVITADIPLADMVIAKHVIALNPRGELYTPQNIKQRLAMRNLSTDLRSAGVNTKGPDKLSKKDLQNFANHLDAILARQR